MTAFRIAVLPGDGIGPEVIAEAERVLLAAGERFGMRLGLPRFAAFVRHLCLRSEHFNPIVENRSLQSCMRGGA